jgi:hypothetical protein
VVSDAIGYTYTEEGHEFYVLILPTADATWVYDLTTGYWHQRAVVRSDHGPVPPPACQLPGELRRDAGRRGLCERPDLPAVAQLLRGRPVPAGCPSPLRRMCGTRTTATGWSTAACRSSSTRALGLATGQGSDPQAMLRWSNDGGLTWGNEHWASIGKMGKTHARVIWRRLGVLGIGSMRFACRTRCA